MTLGLFDLAFVGAAGGGLWTPAAITTALWLDAADAGTITQSGGAVSQWNDKSDNARHVSQATSSRQPAYTLNGLNSKPVITFADDRLTNATFDWSGSAHTAFFVLRKTGANVFRAIATNGTGATAEFAYGIAGANPANGYSLFRLGQLHIGFNTTNQDSNHIACFTSNGISSGGLSANLFVNGAADALNPRTIASLTSTAGIAIGANAAFNETFSGFIAEVIFLASVADANTRQRIEGYLAHKWGLTAKLPNDHPYKSAAPTL
jgi:hypothetical protein